MKSAVRILLSLVLLLSVLTAPAWAQARQPKPGGGATQPWKAFEKELGLETVYSVDMQVNSMGMEMESKIARDGDKSRTEMTMPMMNLEMVVIEVPDLDGALGYTLFPAQKKYALNTDEEFGAQEDIPTPEITELGTEMYEGEECVKRSVSMDAGGMKADVVILFSPSQRDMPIQMSVDTKMSAPGRAPVPVQTEILFRNYDFSTPDASLFEVPAGYQQVQNVGEVIMESMGGMMPPAKAGQTPMQP